MRISIIGSGYVGLVSAVCFAEKGIHVFCVDIDESKVEMINNCISPIYENGLSQLLEKNITNKRLIATTNLEKAVLESDLSIIAVGTPFNGSDINLSYIETASEQIGKALKKKNSYHVVINKSTVIPGTADTVILPLLEKFSGKKVGNSFGLGVNPEFLREGSAVDDFMNPDRIVIGSVDKRTIIPMLELYESFYDVEKVFTNKKTAEMIKYTSNSLLATLISFSNEIGNICASTPEVDVKDVMKGLHLDKRLNPILSDGTRVNPGILSYLNCGCGFGGSCFPKDVKAFISYANSVGESMILLKSVIEINRNQPLKLIELLSIHFKSFNNLKVAVLGLAFKENTDDMRESPAIPIINSLLHDGAFIKAYDPAAKEEAKKIFGFHNIEYPENLKDTLRNVDAVILITGWNEFNKLSAVLSDLDQNPLIIDGRRMLNKDEYEKYVGVGINNER